MQITPAQKQYLLEMIADGKPEQAIDRCIELLNDDLAFSLLEKGGYATLQLNHIPGNIPRIRYEDPEKVVRVDAVKIDGMIIVRNTRQTPAS